MYKILENCKYRTTDQGSYPCNVCCIDDTKSKWEFAGTTHDINGHINK